MHVGELIERALGASLRAECMSTNELSELRGVRVPRMDDVHQEVVLRAGLGRAEQVATLQGVPARMEDGGVRLARLCIVPTSADESKRTRRRRVIVL